MRYLYYCNSAYQLVNALNLNWQRRFNNFENIKDYDSDLIILNAFNGADEACKNLSNTGLFRNVTLINRVKNSGLLHSVSTLLDIIYPTRYINKAGSFELNEVKNNYDYLVVPKISRITFSIWLLNKKANIQLYEEGMGSYYGGMHMCFEYNTHQNLYKLLNNGRDFTCYENIYLNNPELYLDKDKEKVIKIPTIDNKCLETIKDKLSNLLFENPNKEIFWIGQYLKDSVNEVMKDSLEDLKENVVFCPHPRFKEENNGYKKLESNKIWELGLLNVDDLDNKCLFSIYSTAVFSPKLLYDKEPYLILTINMLENGEDEHFVTMRKLIESFKKTYRDQDKIMLPNNKEELKNCLNSVIKRK